MRRMRMQSSAGKGKNHFSVPTFSPQTQISSKCLLEVSSLNKQLSQSNDLTFPKYYLTLNTIALRQSIYNYSNWRGIFLLMGSKLPFSTLSSTISELLSPGAFSKSSVLEALLQHFSKSLSSELFN